MRRCSPVFNAELAWCILWLVHFKAMKSKRARDLNFYLAMTQPQVCLSFCPHPQPPPHPPHTHTPERSAPPPEPDGTMFCLYCRSNPASWQAVRCDTSVGGKGSWRDGSSTCPAGDTWGRSHGDGSCRPAFFCKCALLREAVPASQCHLHLFTHHLGRRSCLRVQRAPDDAD